VETRSAYLVNEPRPPGVAKYGRFNASVSRARNGRFVTMDPNLTLIFFTFVGRRRWFDKDRVTRYLVWGTHTKYLASYPVIAECDETNESTSRSGTVFAETPRQELLRGE
jgi:hypothetical protein